MTTSNITLKTIFFCRHVSTTVPVVKNFHSIVLCGLFSFFSVSFQFLFTFFSVRDDNIFSPQNHKRNNQRIKKHRNYLTMTGSINVSYMRHFAFQMKFLMNNCVLLLAIVATKSTKQAKSTGKAVGPPKSGTKSSSEVSQFIDFRHRHFKTYHHVYQIKDIKYLRRS